MKKYFVRFTVHWYGGGETYEQETTKAVSDKDAASHIIGRYYNRGRVVIDVAFTPDEEYY